MDTQLISGIATVRPGNRNPESLPSNSVARSHGNVDALILSNRVAHLIQSNPTL